MNTRIAAGVTAVALGIGTGLTGLALESADAATRKGSDIINRDDAERIGGAANYIGKSALRTDRKAARHGELRMYRNDRTGEVTLVNLASRDISRVNHRSGILLLEADCKTRLTAPQGVKTEVSRTVKTKVVTLKFTPRYGQVICAEGSNVYPSFSSDENDVDMATGLVVFTNPWR